MVDVDRFDAELDRRTDALFRSFEQDTDQVLDPLPPSQIRRLGERRRNRRRTGIVAGTLALTTVAAASAASLGGLGRPDPGRIDTASSPSASRTASQLPVMVPSRTPVPTALSTPSSSATPSEPSDTAAPPDPPTPGPSSQPPSPASQETSSPVSPQPADAALLPPASWAAVPDSSTIYVTTSGDMAVTSELADDTAPQQSVSVCDNGRYNIHQASDLNRHLKAADSSGQAHVMVYSFTTVEQATAARGVIRSWYHGCPGSAPSRGVSEVTLSDPVDLPVGSAAKRASATTQSTYRSLSYTDTTGTQLVEQATLIQVGNRLAWLTFTTDAGSAPAPHDSPVRRDAVQLSNQLTD